MKKWRIFFFLCAFMLLAAASAQAARPTGGLRSRSIDEARPTRGVRITGTKSAGAGETFTWTVSYPAGGSYDYSICIFDGTYSNANTADVLYLAEGVTESTVSCDMLWVPGRYAFWVDAYREDGSDDASVYYEFTVTPAEGTNELDRRVEQVAGENIGTDDYETVMNLRAWVIGHCDYDYSYTYYSAESIFFLNRGVCNSYSRAFDLLLRAAGIPSRRVVGLGGGDGHAWNAVRIDGRWYLYDLTWDDDNSGYWGFRYCGLTDELMGLDHTPQNYVGGTVTCDSLDSNYFVRSGEWTELSDSLDVIETLLADGYHRFSLDTVCGWADEDDRYVFNSVFAAGLSARLWRDRFGIDCPGVFTANKRAGNITGFLEGSGMLTLPDGLTDIGEEAFARTGANYVFINNGCTAIGSGAFNGCPVWEVTIPGSVRIIADDAFDSYPGLLIYAPAGSCAADWADAHGCLTAPLP